MNQNITALIKGAPVVAPEDSLRRAASLMRTIEGSTVIVTTGPRILGTLNEKAITAALAHSDDPEKALDTPVSAFLDPNLIFINSGVTMQEAAGIFSANDVDMLPVIDPYGNYHGVLFRADLVSYMARCMKMPPVGGMATPLGVYLTTGSITGGAGDLGLFLSGVSLGVMAIASGTIVYGLVELISHITKFPLQAYLNSPPIKMLNVMDIPSYAVEILFMLVFGLFLRYSPLAGYHGAEHMTVNAIEARDVLQPDTVSRMSRVHPRCGTNLLVAVYIFMFVTSHSRSEYSLIVGILMVLFFWRRVGAWAQEHVTTRTPSEKQLASGIAAGKQLMEKFHECPNCQAVGFNRIWRMGLLQTFAGATSVLLIISQLLQRFIHAPWLAF